MANYDSLLPHEKWILSRLRATVDSITEGMEKLNFSEKGQELIAFLRDELADFAVEEYKLTKTTSPHGSDIMSYAVLTTLALLHPYIPFVTDELYGRLTNGKHLIVSKWPVCKFLRDESLEKDFILLYEVIREVRNVRASKGVKPGDLVEAIFVTGKKSTDILEANRTILRGLAKLSEFQIIKKAGDEYAEFSYAVVKDVEMYLNTSAHIDTEAEKIRLRSEIENKKEYIRIVDIKLTNKDFVKNAPEKIVRIEQEKKHQAEEQLEKLLEKFSKLDA